MGKKKFKIQLKFVSHFSYFFIPTRNREKLVFIVDFCRERRCMHIRISSWEGGGEGEKIIRNLISCYVKLCAAGKPLKRNSKERKEK